MNDHADRAPDVRPAALMLVSIASIALLAACGGGGSPAPNPYAPRTATAVSTIPAIPASPVEGVVTAVTTEGLDKITSFTIRTTDGASWEFVIRTLENAAEFPPAHLVEHKATAAAIRVAFHLDGSALVADRIDDAD